VRPGQIELNEFELAILQALAQKKPGLLGLMSKLCVLSREFTGVGSYTNFNCARSSPDLANERVGWDKIISMPGVPNGLGALLFCKEGKPDVLEVYTHGSELWDGVYSGFRL
jgi:hypothetical protein